MRTQPFLLAALASTFSFGTLHAENYVGSKTASEFFKATSDAGEKIKAITPTETQLSAADQELLNDIVTGGMKQLVASEAAVKMAKSEDVKDFAKAEVDEQKGLGDKLKELAKAKGATLPEEATSKAEDDLKGLKAKSGEEFDKEYLRIAGVEGHKALWDVMTKVKATASDSDLKQIAEIALPLIKIHLTAAEEEQGKGK